MNLSVAADIYQISRRGQAELAAKVLDAGAGEKVRVPDQWVKNWKKGYSEEGLKDPGTLWFELSQHHASEVQDNEDPSTGSDPWNELDTWDEKDKIKTESAEMNEDIKRLKELSGLMEGPSIPFSDRPEFDQDNAKDGPLGISARDQKKAAGRGDAAASSDPTALVFSEPGKKSAVSSIANRMDDPSMANDPATKKAEFLKALLQSPGAILGEIAERLSPADENSLAAGDRLNDIGNTLQADEFMSFTDLPDDDKQFAIQAVATAIKNMELVAGSPEKDTYDPSDEEEEGDGWGTTAGDDFDDEEEVEPSAKDLDEPVESVDFDGIREDFDAFDSPGERATMDEGEAYQGECPDCNGDGCKECDFTGKKQLPEAVDEAVEVDEAAACESCGKPECDCNTDDDGKEVLDELEEGEEAITVDEEFSDQISRIKHLAGM
jgi:hypothetical protein